MEWATATQNCYYWMIVRVECQGLLVIFIKNDDDMMQSVLAKLLSPPPLRGQTWMGYLLHETAKTEWVVTTIRADMFMGWEKSVITYPYLLWSSILI